MADENPTPASPQGATEVSNINTNLATEQPTPTGTEVSQSQPAVDLHGLDPNQLGDIAKFLKGQGGFEALKARISSPRPEQAQSQLTQPAGQTQAQAQTQMPSEQNQPVQTAPATPPKGYRSLQQIQVENYFKGLAQDPKYSNIAENIVNGDILREMTAFGMTPIDENYNINTKQINDFLDLKAASVPAKQTSVEPTNIPTVTYVNDGKDITNRDTALAILKQDFDLRSRGLASHPDAEKAKIFLQGTTPAK